MGRQSIELGNENMEHQQIHRSIVYYRIIILILIISLIAILVPEILLVNFLYSHETKLDKMEEAVQRLDHKFCEYHLFNPQ